MIFENFRIALKAILANKLRSVLTTVGIVIGVAAVIAVVSIVQGLDYVITQELEGVGVTYIRVAPRQNPHDPELAGREVKLTYEDGLALMERISSLKYYNPILYRTDRIHNGDRTESVPILGIGEHHQEVSNHWIDRGRFFSRLDLARRAKVCLIGTKLIDDLELDDDPIGQEISLGDAALTIVGIMEQKGEMFGQDRDQLLLIPITTAIDIYGTDAAKQLILDFQAESAEVVQRVKDQMVEILRNRHAVPADAKDDFQVVLQEEMLETTGSILGTITSVVAAVVGVALLVGGIGIMNIMLVSVTERTREIGIRKAVGARRTDILVQFLIEAITLSLLGGLLGVLAGWGIGILGAKAIPGFPPAHVPPWAVLLGFGFAALVGVFFGTWPAAKASSLDPIEALRYE